jgi:hypothetical protein
MIVKPRWQRNHQIRLHVLQLKNKDYILKNIQNRLYFEKDKFSCLAFTEIDLLKNNMCPNEKLIFENNRVLASLLIYWF